MNSPIEQMMDSLVVWTPVVSEPDSTGDLPHVTHEGVLSVGAVTLRCYTLSNGQRILDKEDVDAIFSPTSVQTQEPK